MCTTCKKSKIKPAGRSNYSPKKTSASAAFSRPSGTFGAPKVKGSFGSRKGR